MEIKYILTAEDLATASQYYGKHVSPFRKFYKMAIYFAIVVIPICAILMYYLGEIGLALFVIFMWVILLSSSFISRRLTTTILTKWRRSDRLKGNLGPHTLTVLPKGIVISSEFTRNEMSWNALSKVELTSDGLYILFMGFNLILIPRRSVASGILDLVRSEIMRKWEETDAYR